MNTADVATATITWARTAAEADLLEQSLEALARIGMRITVADRGVDHQFLERLRSKAALHVLVAPPGLVPQVQQSLARAAEWNTPFVLFTEPDKRRFFEHGLQAFVAAAPAGDDVGVVLAARSPDSFETFPPLQRYTESVINHLCAELIGIEGDYCYGPLLIRRELLSHVAALPPALGWGWRPSTCLAAHRRGWRVVLLTGDYECPPDQRHEDRAERAHRLRQLSENVLGLVD
jgi:hypothetical protein